MAYRSFLNNSHGIQGPTAPRKRFPYVQDSQLVSDDFSSGLSESHPLTDLKFNNILKDYEIKVKSTFDQIVPVLKRISTLQHEDNFLRKSHVKNN